LGPLLHLGGRRTIAGKSAGAFELPADELVTHGVVVGMTGSGKTGLVSVLVEEALKSKVPVLLFDVKGDLANLKLCFADPTPEQVAPWVEAERGDPDGVADAPVVQAAMERHAAELTRWHIGAPELRSYVDGRHIRVITPGSDAGEPLHILSARERRSPRWDHDVNGARDTLAAAVSVVLRLIGREADPGKSREHALLLALAERRMRSGAQCDRCCQTSSSRRSRR